MKNSKIFRNYTYTVAYRLLVVVSTFITTPYVSRALGDEAIGIYTYTSTIANYFILFGLLGANTCGYREIAYAQNDIELRSCAFWQMMRVRALSCGLSAVIFCILYQHMRFGIYQGVWLIEIIANLLDISWFYNGIEEFRSSMLRNIIVRIVSLILILSLIKDKQDLLLYILVQTGTVLAGNICLWCKMPRYILKPIKERLDLKKYFIPVIVMFLPQIIDSVYTMLDKLMLGQISTIVQVGYYGQADRIVSILVSLVNAVPLVYGPKVANFFAQKNFRDIPGIISTSFKFTFLISFPIAFGVAGIAYGMVPWFFGIEFLPVADLLLFYSMTIILSGINTVISWQYLLNVKEDKKYIITVLAGAVIDFILNLILIPQYKAMGAVIATVLSMIAMVIVSGFFAWRVIEKRQVFISFIKPFFAAIIMFLLLRKLSMELEINILNTMIEVVLGGFLYILILFFAKEETVWHYFMKVRGVLYLWIRKY